eukprot:5758917-Amphidinium_carterae.1
MLLRQASVAVVDPKVGHVLCHIDLLVCFGVSSGVVAAPLLLRYGSNKNSSDNEVVHESMMIKVTHQVKIQD